MTLSLASVPRSAVCHTRLYEEKHITTYVHGSGNPQQRLLNPCPAPAQQMMRVVSEEGWDGLGGALSTVSSRDWLRIRLLPSTSKASFPNLSPFPIEGRAAKFSALSSGVFFVITRLLIPGLPSFILQSNRNLDNLQPLILQSTPLTSDQYYGSSHSLPYKVASSS